MGAGPIADNCAACHRVHTSQGEPLLGQTQTALCYTCHGSSGTGASTDVEDGVGYSGAGRSGENGALRGGGFKYALIDSANPSGQETGYSDPNGVVPVLSEGQPVSSSHSVDSSKQTAWGNGPISAEVNYGKSIMLRCGSCHDPHGNGKYRLLRPIPTESGGSSVSIADASTKVYTTANYWQVADPNAPQFIEKISEWCAACHTRYLSSTSYTNSGDAVFTQRHISNQTKQGKASCIQCHVVHGSNANDSEASAGGVHSLVGVPAPADGYLLRIDAKGTCTMCHK
ncbi:MAG TPA: cytochrome c3 family protein [Solirubrobacterales bacterium]|nr:cytochrome c3 family protein [Solirubrobacterales bacterium]